MPKALAVLIVLTLIVVAVIPSVSAITYGEPDAGRHPNVGALVIFGEDEYGPYAFSYCSGTLIASNVLLTAAHCGGLPNPVTVSFDEEITPTSTRYYGTFIPHPSFPGPQNDSFDVAVVILNDSPGLPYAHLPTLGQFDNLKRENKNQAFTAVGYGVGEPRPIPHLGITNSLTPWGKRYLSIGSLNAVTPAWLHLSQNIATDDGGTCYGDSGGPNFLGAGAGADGIIAGVTITGDAVCRATNVIYRLDTPSARDFLGQYVSLP